MTDWTGPAIAIAASILGASLLLKMWNVVFPVKENAEVDSMDFEVLRKRYAWINNVATLMMALGLILPAVLAPTFRGSVFWIFGLMIGGVVIGHISWVALVTLPIGTAKFQEYWCYYSLRWKIGSAGIKFIYMTAVLVGLVSAFNIYL
jgi:hypothetical protein